MKIVGNTFKLDCCLSKKKEKKNVTLFCCSWSSLLCPLRAAPPFLLWILLRDITAHGQNLGQTNVLNFGLSTLTTVREHNGTGTEYFLHNLEYNLWFDRK